jgi:FkbM family methyltransferase
LEVAILKYGLNPPVSLDNEARISMTASCRDCDELPKVDNAGAVVEESGRYIQVMHNGLRVVAGGYYGQWMTELIGLLQGHHEPQEELVFSKILGFLSDDATMIELGGFWAYYSLWFLHEGKSRKAIVVEPDPNHIRVGSQNAELNGETMIFVQASAGGTVLSERPFSTESAGSCTIPQVTVSSLMNEHQISHLELLHFDIQGAETEVLQSCENLLREKRISFCVISTHSHHISGDTLTHQKCVAMVQEFGGQLLVEHDVHESFSGDGLVAAYFGAAPIDWEEPRLSRNRYSTSLFRNPLYDLASVAAIRIA